MSPEIPTLQQIVYILSNKNYANVLSGPSRYEVRECERMEE
jgi:hypothetical protein